MKTFKQFMEEQQSRSVMSVIWSFYWRFICVVALMWVGFFIFIALLTALFGA